MEGGKWKKRIGLMQTLGTTAAKIMFVVTLAVAAASTRSTAATVTGVQWSVISVMEEVM